MTVNDMIAKLLDLQKQSKGLYTIIIPRGLVDEEASRLDVRDDEKKVGIV